MSELPYTFLRYTARATDAELDEVETNLRARMGEARENMPAALAWSTARWYQARLDAALAYQETLTKQGKPRKVA